MEYNTIIDIYDRLVEVSAKLHEDFDFDAHGFDKCIFVLHNALKRYEAINLHIDNKNLRNQIADLKGKYDEFLSGKLRISERNKELVEENNKLSQQLKSANGQLSSYMNRNVIKHTAGFSKVEIDFESQPITFLINTDTKTFNDNFNDATNYIYSKRKKRVDISTIKNWYLEKYRALGFTCVSG